MAPKLTKKDIMQEIVKCGKDQNHFINYYCKISHPLKGVIPFKTFDYQKQLLKDYGQFRFNIILKARQLGISTVTAAYVSWLIMFHRSKEVLIIATKQRVAINLLKKVKHIIKKLPDWLQIAQIENDNEMSLMLSNGSKVTASSTSGDAGRSEALSLLVVDEAAHIMGFEEIWTALYPTLSTGGRCIALSSPNGTENWFYRVFSGAEKKENEFHPTTLYWNVHPERDQAWFDKETKNMSQRQIAQELLCDFLMSGESVFGGETIAKIEKLWVREPLMRTAFDRNLHLWEKYQTGYDYLLVADVARGDGADYSAFIILKLQTMEIIGEYRGKCTPDIFANVVNQTAQDYGYPLVVIENNSVGFTVLDKLIGYRYPNLYFSHKGSHDFVSPMEAENNPNCVAGFSTTMKTRPLIIAKAEEYIRNNLIRIYSKRLTDEMRTFIWNNGRAEASKNANDDLVMCMAIAAWVRDTAIQVNTVDLEYKKAFLDCMRVEGKTIDTRISGMRGYDNSENAKVQRQQMDEFFWIYKG